MRAGRRQVAFAGAGLLLALLVTPVVPRLVTGTDEVPIAVTGYDIVGTAGSGFGCWTYDYTGTTTQTGRIVGGTGCPSVPVVDLGGGAGTLADGSVAAGQLFTSRADEAGTPLDPRIQLHLATTARITRIELIGDTGGYSWAAGFITDLTVEIGGREATVATIPTGRAGWDGTRMDDRVDLSASSLGSRVTDTVAIDHILSAWTYGPIDQYTIAEIEVFGVPALPDTTAPELSLPDNLSAEATSAAGAAVSFDVSAHDDEDGDVAASCIPASGSSFQLGTTTVTCTARDESGNQGNGSFTIDVVDTTAPVITFSSHPSIYTLTDQVVVTCAASDSVGVVGSACFDVDAPAWAVPGPNTVEASAWDAAGNIGYGSTTFETIATYDSMKTLTRDWVWKAGVEAQLVGYLDAAARAEAKGNLKAKASNIDGYRALLRAQIGKAIDPYFEDILWSRCGML